MRTKVEYQEALKIIDDYVWSNEEPHWQTLSSAFAKLKELIDNYEEKK